MRRGTPTIARTHAVNYHYREAQARLDETVAPFNAQTLNALNVDHVPAYYYKAVNSGRPCTCDQIEAPVEDGLVVVSTPGGALNGVDAEETYEVVGKDQFNALFGDHANDAQDADGFDFDDTEAVPLTNMNQIFAGGNVDCGVCYRTGRYLSHDLHLGTRLVLGPLNMEDAEGYFLDRRAAPNAFIRQHPLGYVLFTVTVPKYVMDIRFSIRNNIEILAAANLYDADVQRITKQYLLQNQGKRIEVVVTEPRFTHAVVEFLTDIDPVRVNLAGVSKTLDYTMLETIGNLSVIAPMTISVVSSGDVIALPSRNIYLKVVDVEYNQTATMRKLEWRLQCRVLQPTEALKRISFHTKL